MINIKFKYLAIVAYTYMLLPIVIFFTTWLKWYVGIPMSIILIMGTLAMIRKDYLNNNNSIKIPYRIIIPISIIIFIWTWISGQGGFFFQTWDNHSRNAIFRDLINFSWPVIYPETGYSLVYYLVYWLVPAIIGKLLGWTAANIALLLWSYFGIMISFLLISYIIQGQDNKKLWIICGIFILWSGLNVIGMSITDILDLSVHQVSLSSNEGWLDYFYNGYPYDYLYRNNFDSLSQIYNQAIIIWIVVPLFLENRKVRNFAYLGLIMLPYAPIPLVGMLPFFIAVAMQYYIKKIKNKKIKCAILETFSITNISAIVSIFIVFFLFYKCNVSYGSNLSGQDIGLLYVPLESYDIKRIFVLLLFYILEFLIFMILINKKYKEDLIYYTVLLTLIIIPIFRIGTGRDFCMNASLPAIFILMIYMINYIISIDSIQTYIITTIIVTMMSLSPIGDILGRVKIIMETKCFPIVADETKTLSNMRLGDDNPNTFEENYIVPCPENKIFYKYFADIKFKVKQ